MPVAVTAHNLFPMPKKRYHFIQPVRRKGFPEALYPKQQNLYVIKDRTENFCWLFLKFPLSDG